MLDGIMILQQPQSTLLMIHHHQLRLKQKRNCTVPKRLGQWSPSGKYLVENAKIIKRFDNKNLNQRSLQLHVH